MSKISNSVKRIELTRERKAEQKRQRNLMRRKKQYAPPQFTYFSAHHDPLAWIYFVQAGQCGPIKIGISDDVLGRVATLQTSHWEKLRVLATTIGTYTDEKNLHKRFKQIRIRGEWFEPDDELLSLISTYKSRKCNLVQGGVSMMVIDVVTECVVAHLSHQEEVDDYIERNNRKLFSMLPMTYLPIAI